MRDGGVEGRVVLAVREVGGDESEKRSGQHILPVVAVVHGARDRDEGSAGERNERDPRLHLWCCGCER